MTRNSPGSVRSLVRGGVLRYRELQPAERIVYTTWAAAVLATVLGLIGVGTYQAAASQPQSETCTVSAVSPTYWSEKGAQYRFVDTSCGTYPIRPGDRATSVLEPAADSLAFTGSPTSGPSYVLTFTGWGSCRTLVSAMSH
jgi:hypothetical protein